MSNDESDEDWFERAIGDDDGCDQSDESSEEMDEGTDGAKGEASHLSESPSPKSFGMDDEFGGTGTSNDDGDVFDDDFSSSFEETSDEAAYDDVEIESDIPRIDLGIDGLDNMIQGGIPERDLITAIGAPGTGKTTFGLQFLHHGLTEGEDGVFITLEQNHESIVDTANEWDWDFESYEKDDRLAIVDLDPVEMANSLDNIRVELPELIKDFGADRFVLDSVSLLEMMYDDPATRRTEVYDFTRSLKQAGVTTFLTSEASEANPYASRHGIIEYLTDAVFVLQFIRSESQDTRLAIEIMKIRNANHSRARRPFELTSNGISVYQEANIF